MCIRCSCPDITTHAEGSCWGCSLQEVTAMLTLCQQPPLCLASHLITSPPPSFSFSVRFAMTTPVELLPSQPDQELSPGRLDGCEDIGGRYKVVPSVERVLDTQLSVEASMGIGLGIGTLCGLVTMLVRSVGLFMVGLLLGLLVAVATLVGMEELSDSPSRSVWVTLGVLLGLGMLFAVLTLQWQRLFTTLSTAMFGAAVITVALDYFVELFALVLYMYERIKVAPGKPVCWLTWVVLGVWPALTLLGVMVQWKVTAEGYSHTKVIISRQQRRMQVMRIRQRDDRYRNKKKKKQQHGSSSSSSHHSNQAKQLHPEPAYRRKPNPIRRYDTDVLSPSYIQSFRERQVQVQPVPSRLVGRPHTMVDIAYDRDSTTPLTGAAGPSLNV
ncbi:hypothetical protein FQN60_006528 [Etheostoma spectabile]|uniref:Transmembrane protein 198 n=1 Tax=Etheostoma spectabile TaxID=54343 RepID=A0A5J5CE95_9PERO|nr:hypothetical protein FQN60_006528 [Etheostoma spectabile]